MKRLLLLLLLPSLSWAYDYPYADPYYATITASFLKADHLDKSIRYQDIYLKPIPARDAVPYYGEKRNHLTLRLWPGKKNAPLIFLLAGVGGSHAASYSNYLGYHFSKKGFHVVAIPSPFHWQFVLSAGALGSPGLPSEDARDVLRVIRLSLPSLREKIEFGKIGLIGVSMGALETAYVASLDKNHLIEKFLLINPPVDPSYSSQVLSDMTVDSLSREQKKKLDEMIYLLGSKKLMMEDIKSPEYFLHLEQSLPLNLEERKYLIGKAMQNFMGPLIFTSEQIRPRGLLQKAQPEERLREAEDKTFSDYRDNILLPNLLEDKSRTVREILSESTMEGIREELTKNERVFLLHNQDDFILSTEHFQFLRETFGSRLKFFPRGGHIGNVWANENKDFILSYFDSLTN